MHLHRIEAFIESLHLPSIKLAVKFGITKEGQMREHFCRDGVFEDSVVEHELQTMK
jgi:ribosomal-protein-alanine N-acetyltransferase